METFISFVSNLNTNVFSKPEYVLAMFALVGCLVMKKPWHEALSAFIKTMVGYFIMTIGSSGLTSTFRPLLFALNDKFNVSAAILDPYYVSGTINAGIAEMPNFMTYALITLVTVYVWNFILVYFSKVTKMRTLYTRSLYASLSGEIFMILTFFPDWADIPHAILMGVLFASRLTMLANLTVEPTRKISGDAGFAIGHQQMTAIFLASKIAPKIGDPDESIENTKLPGWMSILNDSTVATSILMTVFFGAIMLLCGKEGMMVQDTSLKANMWFGTYIISKCLYFSVYMNILISGVRMFSNEIIRAFKGVTTKYLPGATIAVDIAVSYGFAAPTVMMTGFVCGFLGQMTVIALLILFKSPLIVLTGFVPVFFDNCGIAIYANKYGGRKATIILCYLSGIIQAFGSWLWLNWLSSVNITYTGWAAQFDNVTQVPIMYLLTYYFKEIGVAILIAIYLLIPQLLYKTHKEGYFGNGTNTDIDIELK